VYYDIGTSAAGLPYWYPGTLKYICHVEVDSNHISQSKMGNASSAATTETTRSEVNAPESTSGVFISEGLKSEFTCLLLMN
jgi:hypothetical protein